VQQAAAPPARPPTRRTGPGARTGGHVRDGAGQHAEPGAGHVAGQVDRGEAVQVVAQRQRQQRRQPQQRHHLRRRAVTVRHWTSMGPYTVTGPASGPRGSVATCARAPPLGAPRGQGARRAPARRGSRRCPHHASQAPAGCRRAGGACCPAREQNGRGQRGAQSCCAAHERAWPGSSAGLRRSAALLAAQVHKTACGGTPARGPSAGEAP